MVEYFYDWTVLGDFGHGIGTLGKCSPDAARKLVDSPYYLREYAKAREIGYMTLDLLSAYGIRTIPIVKELEDIPLPERTRRVNELCRKYGLSKTIGFSNHVNAAGSGSKWMDARGWSVYTTPGETKSDLIATEMYEVAKEEFYDPKREYIKTFDLRGRQKPIRCDWSDGDADKEALFWMLRKTNCPFVLVENFFQDNKEDVLYLNSPEGMASCAYVMSEGILNYIRKYGTSK